MRPFVFLDRDGTLTVDRGYTYRIEDYQLFPGVAAGLRRLSGAGYALAVVTNQSGIARGFFGVAELEAFHRHLVADLARQGVRIESTFHCPHLPEAGCGCRKPEPGLLQKAERDLGADLARSWVIGDQRSDVILATRARCRGAVLVLTGKGQRESAEVPDAVPRARDLLEAAQIVGRAGSVGQGAP